MPKETGLSFVHRLHAELESIEGEETSRIPVIMVSGDIDSKHVDAVQQAGIRAMVQKPFRPTAFAELIEMVFSHEIADEFIYLRTFN